MTHFFIILYNIIYWTIQIILGLSRSRLVCIIVICCKYIYINIYYIIYMHNRFIRLPSLLSCVLIIQRVSGSPLNEIFLSSDLELKWGFREEWQNSETHIFYEIQLFSNFIVHVRIIEYEFFKRQRVFSKLDFSMDLIFD